MIARYPHIGRRLPASFLAPQASHINPIFAGRKPLGRFMGASFWPRFSGFAYQSVYPPSTTKTDPVMKEEASLARSRASGAISSGVA